MGRSSPGSKPPFVKFCDRLFNPLEHARFMARYDLQGPRYSFHTSRRASSIVLHLAGRWAAKEAIIKAVTPKPTFHDITIIAGPNQEPMAIVLDPSSRQELPKIETMEQLFNANGQVVKVSISHDGDYATAVCIASTETGGHTHSVAKHLDVSQINEKDEEPIEDFTKKDEVNDKYALS